MSLLNEQALNQVFLQLKVPDKEVRERAGQELYTHVAYAYRELQPETFLKYFTGVNNQISALALGSADPNAQIGGIVAIDRLIGFHGPDDGSKTTRYLSHLQHILRSNDTDVLVYAARAMGKLATPGGAFTAELVDSEVKMALEWLQTDKADTRRFAAVLLLKEMAKNSPTLLFGWVPQILEYIWPALCDVKVLIRETAAETIRECLSILAARDSRTRTQWFQTVWNTACEKIYRTQTEEIHGGLLAIRELVRAGGMFMNDHFREACEITILHMKHKELRIRSEIVGMIPLLASYAPAAFSAHWSPKFMSFLREQLKKDKERNPAFIAIGELALAIKGGIQPYLDSILLAIREGLGYRVRTKVKDDKDHAVFTCISKLCVAVGQVLTKYMDALLDPMLACGLSPALTQALSDMAHYVQPVKSAVQEKLLNLISLVLCGRPFKPLGCPDNRLPPIPAFARDWQQHGIVHGEVEVAHALNTLGSFDFKGHVLNEFVRDVALRFVKKPRPEIRKAAALTCCNIYEHDPIIKQTSLHAIAVVRLVISELLSAAVGDPVADIRRTILLALDEKFDRYLAEQDNIRKIIMAVNESDYEVRKAAMAILGRLVGVNPAYVFPPLRKLLQNFTMSIHASKDPIYEEEGAQLISLFVKHTSELVKPFVETLVRTFLPKANDTNPAVASAVISAVGDLATLGGSDMKKFVPQLMPIIIEALQDLSAPSKRDSALITLGQLASNSGYVIEPYIDYPQLLPLLTNIIKTEQQGNVRTHTIRLLGVLGALDPYRHQQAMEQVSSTKSSDTTAVSDVDLMMQGLTPSNDEYFPTVVMHTLLYNVLRDTSLSQYHSAVIEAIVSIFRTLGLKCVSFLPQIIPIFITVIRSAPYVRQAAYFNQLAILVSIVREHIRPFRNDLVRLIKDCWYVKPAAGEEKKGADVQAATLLLTEALSRALHREFYPSIVDLLPLLLGLFDSSETSQDVNINCEKVLHTILVFGQDAEQAMWFILPKLVRTFSSLQRSTNVRTQCIRSVGNIARQTNISDYSALLMHNMGDLLSSKDDLIRNTAYDTIITLMFQFPIDVEPFLDGISLALKQNKIGGTALFEQLHTKIRNSQSLPQDLRATPQFKTVGDDVSYADVGQRQLQVNQEHLKQAWDSSQKTTREDWLEWMRRFSIELLKESPSNALRACSGLASIYPPLAKDLFNAAFVSCFVQLYEQYQNELVMSLERALTSTQIPPEILQTLLNLAEFMEHDDKPLPIDIGTLGKYATKCHAYAKALHYKELEFEEDKSPDVIEALISINNHLQQADAAVGILRIAKRFPEFNTQESWFEKLGQWDEALSRYEEREQREINAGNPVGFEISFGKMKCFHAVGEWEELASLAQEKWSLASIDEKRQMAPLATAASWGLAQWEHMDNYIEAMKVHSPDRPFYGAIRALQQNQFIDAQDHIEKARKGLDTELSALLGESYTRAYSVVVRVQMLAELEEIISYKRAEGDPVKQATMRETWKVRLMGCEGNIETWQRMLKVRALVLTPRENMDLWIKFANLCRKSNRTSLAAKSLQSIYDSPATLGVQVVDGLEVNDRSIQTGIIPEVQYAQLKYDWTVSKGDDGRLEALHGLRNFTSKLSDHCQSLELSLQHSEQNPPNPMNVFSQTWPAEVAERKDSISRMRLLLSKSYLRYGRWATSELKGDWRQHDRAVREILDSYRAAAQYNPDGYKAWHAWALANFEVISAQVGQTGQEAKPSDPRDIEAHVIPAITGFFKSISLSKSKSTLQDTLRLLTLWFAHGGDADVLSALKDGFHLVNMDTWLEVIPQLIARINQPIPRSRKAVQDLLCDVGKVHPQALVYPLTVAMKSDVAGRADSARAVMDQLRIHSTELVDQAQLVSKELIRSAVLWHELWHEGLEEASRLYFGPDKNPEAMFNTLAPLHKLLDDGPETLREISFVHAFGRELSEARQWCERFRQTRDPGDINQAWDLYYGVFRRITKQLQQLMQLDLKYISPALGEAKSLVLAVPGTYASGKPIIRIMSFDKVFTVIPSKQRPRKMALRGSDGQSYTYLLKGHEDIRQDERVMQLFGLVNTLLNDDTESFKRHLNIQKFPVIPLSQNSGLLGWVTDSDTLHNLIKEYRDNRRILLNIEHRIMLQMAPDYDALTLMQKVEVFQYAMDNTTGKDLYRVLWLKSRSSEAWLERRTNYTRSLAVMSMVGYILGLGDRHPSNLLLDRGTGKIIHVDFGDCFEIAMQREKYPERVPFRLTRMLTFAMEVSNIDGSFKLSCYNVMRVIRENKESLMAVLEAFIHDPLLNWRLTARESPDRTTFVSQRRQSLIDAVQPNGNDNVSVMGAHGGAAGASLRDFDEGQLNSISENIPAVQSSYRRPRAGTAAGQAQKPAETQSENREQQNARAVQVLARVKDKLNGRDFMTDRERENEKRLGPGEAKALNVDEQVEKLITQATSVENICQHYIGWCSFW